MTDKLLVLGHFNVHHSICTTLLYKKLFTKWKNMYLFSFYSTKCPARFNFQNAKSLDYSVLRWQGVHRGYGRSMLHWEECWENVVFFSKSRGFFLKMIFVHSNLLKSRRIWMKNSHFDEYNLNFCWKWEQFLICSAYEEVFHTAFSIPYLAVHFWR